jgi:hypothetical protein
MVEDWRVYGYDAGWRDPRVLLEVGKTPYEQLVVLDEFVEQESHVGDALGWLDANDKPEGTIFCEHEPSDIDRFERAGWPTEKAEKSLDAGIAEVRRRLERDGNAPAEEPGPKLDDLAWDGGEAVERVGLLISDRCQQLIREFLGYKEDHVGTSQAIDHCLDSLRYLCMGVAGGGADDNESFLITR